MDILQERSLIEGIAARFGNSVSIYDIMRWLDNFDKEDRSFAIAILERVRYYSTNEIFSRVYDSVIALSKNHNLRNVFFVPMDGVGKSGPLICYYLQRVLRGINSRLSHNILVASDLPEQPSKDDVLCVVDDFAGSGNTIYDVLTGDNQTIFEAFSHRYVMTIAYMPRAKEKLDALNYLLLGDLHCPVFSKNGSPFGCYYKMKPYREFAYKYGNMLTPKKPKSRQTPLGYDNTQALVCFEYSSPNNALPIIWADKKAGGAVGSWYPLFPRWVGGHIERASSVRRNMWLWVAEAKKMTSGVDWLTGDDYRVENVRMFVLLDVICHRRPRHLWAQLLSIGEAELDDVIRLGQKAKFLDENLHLTSIGNVFMKEIKKKVKWNQSDGEDVSIMNNVYEYVPKRFRGVS